MFADKLQAALELRGMSLRLLSQRSGVSQSHISRSINGESLPTVDVAARLAQALDVSLDWLCDLPERRPGTLAPLEDELIKSFRAVPADFQLLALQFVRGFIRPSTAGNDDRSVHSPESLGDGNERIS